MTGWPISSNGRMGLPQPDPDGAAQAQTWVPDPMVSRRLNGDALGNRRKR